jgi:hypothetical protein
LTWDSVRMLHEHSIELELSSGLLLGLEEFDVGITKCTEVCFTSVVKPLVRKDVLGFKSNLETDTSCQR